MGKQIYEQGDGKYCIWSTISDDVIAYDLTQAEVIDEFVADYRAQKVFTFASEVKFFSQPVFLQEAIRARCRVVELRAETSDD